MLLAASAPAAFAADQIEIRGPAGSGVFGQWVSLLPNGNIVVTDPDYSEGATQKMGAVYLFGPTGLMISKLTGSSADDRVGYGQVTVLTNGNFVVSSGYWDNGSTVDVGAVTWIDASDGLSGIVSAQNSLVGSQQGDSVGKFGVQALPRNGNYVVSSPYWKNAAIESVGAVTWGNGAIGIVGPVSTENSLIGSHPGQQLGYERNRGNAVLPLGDGNYVTVGCGLPVNGIVANPGTVTWANGHTGISGRISTDNSLVGYECYEPPITGGSLITRFFNGDYVVTSPYWDNGSAIDAGAVTWGSGSSGVRGVISPTNSLVGSTSGDFVGTRGIRMLSNGNYVIMSRYWDNGSVVDAGASTWVKAGRPITGTVSAANSLVGSTLGESVGISGLIPLSNGNYALRDSLFDNGTAIDAGAITWVDGDIGAIGVISASNSLVGSHSNDRIGTFVAPLRGATDSFLVSSTSWDNGSEVDAGALTWINSGAEAVGEISAANSLIGTSSDDKVGYYLTLANGNYVALTSSWDNQTLVDVGAVSWADGRTGIRGTISPSNSLTGTSAGDKVGQYASSLPSGDYVIQSTEWDNGTITNVGAVTHLSGNIRAAGVVTSNNSLIGSRAEDQVGWSFILLRNGNYVISSPFWSDGTSPEVGAVTWVNGNTGLTGIVAPANSLVGSSPKDYVGAVVTTFNNGHYLVGSYFWDNGALADAGALTWANGYMPTTGVVNAGNSLIGADADDRIGMRYDYPSGSVVPGVTELKKGFYLIESALVDRGEIYDAGAISWAPTDGPTVGMISPLNSVMGSREDGSYYTRTLHDAKRRRLIVGQFMSNLVTIVELSTAASSLGKFDDESSLEADVTEVNSLSSTTSTAWISSRHNEKLTSTEQDHHCKLHPPIGHVSDSQSEHADGCSDQRPPPRNLIRAPDGDGEIDEQAAH